LQLSRVLGFLAQLFPYLLQPSAIFKIFRGVSHGLNLLVTFL
jgi:hypothetical protein